MRRQVITAFILVLLVVSPSFELWAGTFTFTLTNNWTTPSIGAAQISGGAGANFDSSTWESATNAAELEVKHSGMTGWNITVYKVNSAGWTAAGLTLEVKRTGNGVGGANLYDGLSYQTVTGTDTYFFKGEGGDRKNIPLQYQIGNISVLKGAATFSTTVYYTVTEY